MEQVHLNIVHRLPYSATNFVTHSGVSKVIETVFSELSKDGFTIIYIDAPPRYGKTHFTVKLTDLLSNKGVYYRIGEGSDLGAISYQLQTEEQSDTLTKVIVIDNIDSYLLTVNKGESGEFVSFIEWCRLHKIAVIMLSGVKIDNLPCDDHVKSRLRAAIQLQIDEPEDNEVTLIIDALARQRGVRLTQRRINFLTRRLARDIPSLERYVERLIHLSQVLGKSIKFNLIADAL